MELLKTNFGPAPQDNRGENFLMKPSNLAFDKQIEYGVPFEHTDPTYVLAGRVDVTKDDMGQEDELFNMAADVVESYARLGFFGGFIVSEYPYEANSDIHHSLEIWVTDLTS